MKIAYFLDIPKGLGGAGNVLLEQAKLISTIHDVIVVIPCNVDGEMNPKYELRCKKANVRYVGMIYPTAYSVQNIDALKAEKSIKSIKEMAIVEEIDFFHSVQFNIGAELASRELGIPHLMNAYSIRKGEFFLELMDIFPKYHSCDSLLYCRIWEAGLNVKTRCIRPSAPLSYIERKKERNKDTLKILMLGEICEYKNQMLAIQTIELCNENSIKVSLSIAGNDNLEYAHKCKKYIEDNGLEEFVHILGFQNDIASLLKEHDCYLCTSTRESFPCSIVEAITYDLTILSTPVAGVPELLKDERNAYISEGYRVEDVANCIMKCFYAYQDGNIKKIHDEAAILWNENFSGDVVRRQLNEYYQFILDDFYINSRAKLENRISENDIKQIEMRLRNAGITAEDVLSKCYYYTCLTKILKPGVTYIWGAGKYGKYAQELIKILFSEIKVLAYIDQNKKGNYLGITIILPEQIELKKTDYVFLGFVQGREKVIEYLEERGMEYNKDIWILP